MLPRGHPWVCLLTSASSHRLAGSSRRLQATIASSTPPSSAIANHVKSWMDAYEDLIGIRAVKEAQAQVMQWEQRLSEAQLQRRERQVELKNIQGRIKEIHFDLDRTSRGEDKYLALITEEHETIKRERQLLETFESCDSAEREAFHRLSIHVRESHERERERVEKTKWWGVSASLCGALIGIVGSTIGNHLRMKKIKELLPSSQEHLNHVIASAEEQQNVLKDLVVRLSRVVDGKEVVIEKRPTEDRGEKMLTLIREDNARLLSHIRELTQKMQIERAIEDPESVVYVGSEMERLLDQTERNLESKMKLQTLLSVVVLYSALGLTIPVIWAIISR